MYRRAAPKEATQLGSYATWPETEGFQFNTVYKFLSLTRITVTLLKNNVYVFIL